LIERALEDAARELKIDPVELRRRNIISPAAMPYQTALGPNYDCGEFAKNMETALVAADYASFVGRREESRRRGMLRGIGLANAIEAAAGPGICRSSLQSQWQRDAADGHQGARPGS